MHGGSVSGRGRASCGGLTQKGSARCTERIDEAARFKIEIAA
jgi:hypothetical protein